MWRKENQSATLFILPPFLFTFFFFARSGRKLKERYTIEETHVCNPWECAAPDKSGVLFLSHCGIASLISLWWAGKVGDIASAFRTQAAGTTTALTSRRSRTQWQPSFFLSPPGPGHTSFNPESQGLTLSSSHAYPDPGTSSLIEKRGTPTAMTFVTSWVPPPTKILYIYMEVEIGVISQSNQM